MSEQRERASARLRAALRPVGTLLGALWSLDRIGTAAWCASIVISAALPSVLAIATGMTVDRLGGPDVVAPLAVVVVAFAALQVLPSIAAAVSASLGTRLTANLDDELLVSALAPSSVEPVEDPEVRSDIATAQALLRGGEGPPLHLAIDVVRTAVAQLLLGLVAGAALLAYAWWAAIALLIAWLATHWLLRVSARWAERDAPDMNLHRYGADVAYAMATDPAFAKESRLFGLGEWIVRRFDRHRMIVHRRQYAATAFTSLPVVAAGSLVLVANAIVLVAFAVLLVDGTWQAGAFVAAVQLALAMQAIGFGAVAWALDEASSPVVVARRAAARLRRAAAADLAPSPSSSLAGQGPADIVLEGVVYRYPGAEAPALDRFDARLVAGGVTAIVGENGAGKTTVARMLCGLAAPSAGTIAIDGRPLSAEYVLDWRSRCAAVFQDFARFEHSVREMVDPGARFDDEAVETAVRDAGLHGVTLEQPLSRGLPDGIDLSGGQWQRLVLARAIVQVRHGARLVLLDEPTSSLDGEGEAMVYSELVRTVHGVTTVLVTHRLASVRDADRILYVHGGRVVEVGSHDELMRRQDGRYRRSFEAQAHRFRAEHDETGERYDRL